MDTSAPSVIVTTTAQLDDRPVREYLGIVTGEAIVRIASHADRRSSPAHRLCSSPTPLAQRVSDARDQAIAAMVRHANDLGGTAIIAVGVDYATVQRPHGDEILVITASGSVVTL